MRRVETSFAGGVGVALAAGFLVAAFTTSARGVPRVAPIRAVLRTGSAPANRDPARPGSESPSPRRAVRGSALGWTLTVLLTDPDDAPVADASVRVASEPSDYTLRLRIDSTGDGEVLVAERDVALAPGENRIDVDLRSERR